MNDLRCMSYVGKEFGQIVVAGCQDKMLKIDVEKGRILELVRCQLKANVLLLIVLGSHRS